MMETTIDIYQDGMMVASVTAPTPERAIAEAQHYGLMYGQDGPVEFRTKLKLKQWASLKALLTAKEPGA